MRTCTRSRSGNAITGPWARTGSMRTEAIVSTRWLVIAQRPSWYRLGRTNILDSPRRREAAFCHGDLSHCYAQGALLWTRRGRRLHVVTHAFDYIVLGILIACMLGAAAAVLSRRNS